MNFSKSPLPPQLKLRSSSSSSILLLLITITTTLIITLSTTTTIVQVVECASSKVTLQSSGSTFSSQAQLNIKSTYTQDTSHTNSLDYRTEEDSISGLRRLILNDNTPEENNVAHVDFNSVKIFPYNSSKSQQEDSSFREKAYSQTMCVESLFGILVFVMNGNFQSSGVKIQQRLSLSLETIIDIYNGKIKYWNDTKIVNENPSISSLPSMNQAISVLSRSSTSGTSFNLLQYLSTFDSNFLNQPQQFALNPTTRIRNLNLTSLLPNSNLLIHTNKDMIEYLKNIEGSFGYTSLNSYANSKDSNNLILINLIVNSKSVVPSIENARNTISKFNSASFFQNTNSIYSQSLSIAKSNNENHYPLITPTFWCFTSYQSDSEEGIAMLQFFTNTYKYLNRTISTTTTTTTDSNALLRFSFRSSTRQQVKTEGSLNGVIALPEWLSSTNLQTIRQSLMCGKKQLCSTIPLPSTDVDNDFFLLAILLPLWIVLSCCIVILLLGIAVYCIVKRRRRFKSPSQLNQQLLDIDYMDDTTTNIEGGGGEGSTYTYTPKLFEKEQLKSTIRTEELSLDEQIGSGSFSEVYKGRWLGATVAVKRFLVNHIESEEIVQDFIKESKLMSKLRHPNVVQFMGVCIQMPHLYMVTEYCERGNLQHILKDKKIKISLRKTIALALDSARGMYYLHTSDPPIVHRDFKSANLLVDKNWSVKVGDFGMSRMMDSQQQMTVCGTAETCAPEVLKRSMYTEKADVYSFGIVLWEMFTRNQLYPGMNFYELSSRVVNEGLRPDISGSRFTEGHIPKSIEQLMTSCWDEDPEVRPNFAQIVKQLEMELNLENQKKNKGE